MISNELHEVHYATLEKSGELITRSLLRHYFTSPSRTPKNASISDSSL